MNNDHLVSNILKYLHPIDLEQTKLVNKQWYEISTNEATLYSTMKIGKLTIDDIDFIVYICHAPDGRLKEANLGHDDHLYSFDEDFNCTYTDDNGGYSRTTPNELSWLPFFVKLFYLYLIGEVSIKSLKFTSILHCTPFDV